MFRSTRSLSTCQSLLPSWTILNLKSLRFHSTSESIDPAVDVLIIGAGVTGLAIARSLPKGKSVYVIEKEKQFGQGISSRSSEVVHAGIYYPKNSQKALWCIQGRRALKRYCLERNIPYVQRGKLIVATNESQKQSLEKVASHAKANGVGDEEGEGLQWLQEKEAKLLEPQLHCFAALHSPATAVIDSHLYMAALESEAIENGIDFVYGSKFISASLLKPSGHFAAIIESSSTRTQETIVCKSIVNCAGLTSPEVAAAIRTSDPKHDAKLPKAYYCKGNYFKLQGVANPFYRLIYPLPEAHGLGVHLTIDIGGSARFGPDVEWIEKVEPSSYIVDPNRANSFYGAIRSYWPELPDHCLVPDYAGIRPKLGSAEKPAVDFLILDEASHGIKGLVHCLGVESPGLTSSLALAQHVVKLL
jgi:L-2-hydroxyglutarate oxidase LhgO